MQATADSTAATGKTPSADSGTSRSSVGLPYIAKLLLFLLVSKTIVSVLVTLRDYFPPNFNSAFLLGRSGYFFESYQWAFYTHVIAGPCVLALGLLLVSDSLRQRFPRIERVVASKSLPSSYW